MSAPTTHAADPATRIVAAFADTRSDTRFIESECRRLRDALGEPPSREDLAGLDPLLPLMRRRFDPRIEPVFRLLDRVAGAASDPWPLLSELLAVESPPLSLEALARLAGCLDAGVVSLAPAVIDRIGELADRPGGPLSRPEALARIDAIVRRHGGAIGPPLALFLRAEVESTRRLAGRLLDLEGSPVRAGVARRVLGAAAYRVLGAYLRYTRATHVDLMCLRGAPELLPRIVEDFRRAERACGPALLREIVTEVGWARLDRGLELRSCIGFRVAGSPVFVVDEREAPLFERSGDVVRAFHAYLAVAHGGTAHVPVSGAAGADRIGRFRACNQTHAELLDLILQMAPLTRVRLERILQKLDRVVRDFLALFSAHTDDCATLPALHAELVGDIRARLDERSPDGPLDAELTRRVLAFEDPHSLGTVRTLHGLKRYLHQRGLELGRHLADRGASADRTVSLVLASPERVVRTVHRIRYADLDGDRGQGRDAQIPFAVALAVDAFALQLLNGQETFPHLDALCYGTEVHYYLSFRNHPAFLRVAFSPPLRGGMIDLRYYGVSNYELSSHPDSSLAAIREALGRLGFEVQIDGALVHARMDKERIVDLDRLIDGAERALGLAPHFMDLDWTIGSLDLDAAAKSAVARAWASRFALWGALPVTQMLTADRRGILLGVDRTAAGDRERIWSGRGGYRDGLGPTPSATWVEPVLEALRAAGIEPDESPGDDAETELGQVGLLRRVLRPLRRALATGAVNLTEQGLRAVDPERLRLEHEAVVFAELLDSGPEATRRSFEVARLIAPLERVLRFSTTGTLNGHPVERARLRLREGWLGLFVLRGLHGVARLAMFCRGTLLLRVPGGDVDPRRTNASIDAEELARLLRDAEYLSAEGGAAAGVAAEELDAIRDAFAAALPPGPLAVPGETVLPGLRAAPGRVVGRAALGTCGRVGAGLSGRVLFAPTLGPEDNTLLYHSLGVVSTAGGVLSHAGLLATQFGKPALVIAGRWETGAGEVPTLVLSVPEFDEHERLFRGFRIRMRHRLGERKVRVREGDLVVLDADAGSLTVLGQQPEALALQDELARLADSARRLAESPDDRELLGQRGRLLRSTHQLRRLLRDLADPNLARHAVRELLLGVELPAGPRGTAESAGLLTALLDNTRVHSATFARLGELADDLEQRCATHRSELERSLRQSTRLYELLASRLSALRSRRAVEEARSVARICGMPPRPALPEQADPDERMRSRLIELRDALVESLPPEETIDGDPFLRHTLRRVEQIDRVLGRDEPGPDLSVLRQRLRESDDRSVERVTLRRVLRMDEAAYEHHTLVGWKAANLAEARRVVHPDLFPPWYVVTDRAFREMLETRVGERPLDAWIRATLEDGELDDTLKSERIRAIWNRVEIPDALASEILAVHAALLGGRGAPGDAAQEPFVAVRSSTREEDAEAAARAGEFETFLFVRGGRSVLDHVKRAWAGLWTERAIHNRRVLGETELPAGGGILVQRMVFSRVSGVLLTVNVARGDPREIVIDAGLGLGEGVVNGVVDVDHFAVTKPEVPGPGSLQFHCTIAEKREQVVYNRRAGGGTIRVPTLYHEGLRPTLDYVELAELVRTALRLETVYGHPLDIEFALAGGRPWILQVRPVASHQAMLRATVQTYPLGAWSGSREWEGRAP